MKLLVLIFFVVNLSFAQQDVLQAQCKPCREHPQVNGLSFVVHGILRVHNGAPSVRLWKIGTKRVLGISEEMYYRDGFCNLPKWLAQKLNPDNEIIGDFVVYPFTADKQGVMRLVCIDTAYNLTIRNK